MGAVGRSPDASSAVIALLVQRNAVDDVVAGVDYAVPACPAGPAGNRAPVRILVRCIPGIAPAQAGERPAVLGPRTRAGAVVVAPEAPAAIVRVAFFGSFLDAIAADVAGGRVVIVAVRLAAERAAFEERPSRGRGQRLARFSAQKRAVAGSRARRERLVAHARAVTLLVAFPARAGLDAVVAARAAVGRVEGAYTRALQLGIHLLAVEAQVRALGIAGVGTVTHLARVDLPIAAERHGDGRCRGGRRCAGARKCWRIGRDTPGPIAVGATTGYSILPARWANPSLVAAPAYPHGMAVGTRAFGVKCGRDASCNSRSAKHRAPLRREVRPSSNAHAEDGRACEN